MQIAIIGTGNVAYHLAKRLHEVMHLRTIVVSRTAEKGESFVKSLNLKARVTTDHDLSRERLGFVLIAVPDREIQNVVNTYQFHEESILLHASGAQSINLLAGKTPQYGVLYPFQTFSKQKPVDFSIIPLLIEGNTPATEQEVRKLAGFLGPNIHGINSEQRLKIHLAAVFACNFTNYMYVAAEKILQNTGMGINHLGHLIDETTKKALELSPKAAQTGPAIRGDHEVLKKHLELLENQEDLEELYKVISRQIVKLRNGE